MKATGTVKWFGEAKGWGYIVPDGGGEDVFVHHTGIAGDGYRNLPVGVRVEFDLVQHERGPRALNVLEIGR